MTSIEIIPMNCPCCGAVLSIPKGLTYLTCNYCQSQLHFFHTPSISSLQLISDKIVGVKNDAEIISAELTYTRLKKELNKLINLRDALYYMVAAVQVASADYYWNDHDLDYQMPSGFKIFAEVTMDNIYYGKPGSPSKPFFTETSFLEKKERLKSTFIEEDFKFLIRKFLNEPDKCHQSKKKLAIEKYISRIEELIKVNREIEVKAEQISEIKSLLP